MPRIRRMVPCLAACFLLAACAPTPRRTTRLDNELASVGAAIVAIEKRFFAKRDMCELVIGAIDQLDNISTTRAKKTELLRRLAGRKGDSSEGRKVCLQALAETLRVVKAESSPQDRARIADVAIEDMLKTLDEGSAYYGFELINRGRSLAGEKPVGVGLILKQVGKFVEVVATVEESPAARSGLAGGDRIDSIDWLSCRGLSLKQVAEKLRGKKGTSVTVGIVREDRTEPMEFPLVRDEVRLPVRTTEVKVLESLGMSMSTWCGSTRKPWMPWSSNWLPCRV